MRTVSPEIDLVQSLPSSHEIPTLGIPSTVYKYVERIGGAAVPSTIEIPEEVLDPIPKVYIHGYCGVELAYGGMRSAGANNGEIGITFNCPRSQDFKALLSKQHFGHPELLLAQITWAAMRGAMKLDVVKDIYPSIEAFDLVGHSMGGPTSTATALRHPDYVRTIIQHEPAGIENHTITQMLSRIPKFAFFEGLPAILGRQIKSEDDLKLVRDTINYVFKRPARTLAEGVVVGSRDNKDNMRMLAPHIKTGLLVGEADTLISAERTLRFGTDVFDLCAKYADPTFNHLAPQIHPRAVHAAQTELSEQLHNNSKQLPQFAIAA